MPKSKRAKTYHLTQVNKKTREEKDQLFQNIRDTVPKFAHCFVLGFDNMRNNHLKDVRREMSDSRYARCADFLQIPLIHKYPWASPIPL